MKSNFFSFLKKSFYIRMILIMLAVSVIPLVILSWISIDVSTGTVEKQVNRLNEQLVNQVVDRVELTMSRLRELSDQYSRIGSIQTALVPPEDLYFEEVTRKKELISLLSTASAVIGNVQGLQVYSAVTGEVLSSYEAPAPLQDSPYRHLIGRFLDMKGTSLFLDKEVLAQEETLTLLQNAVYYISRIPSDRFEEMTGALLISMNTNQFQQQIENIQLGGKGSVSLVTRNGLTVATTSRLSAGEDQERLARILEHWQEQERPNQFRMDASIISVKQTSTYDGWIVISEIPSRELTQSTGIIRQTVGYFLLFLIGLGVIAIIAFGYQLYRPLQAVKRQVDAIKKGHFDARVTHFANNEIGELGRMLNSMAVRIEDLLGDLQESEELKRRLEIRALQSQINPHFMYNTLNTIRMFAMLKDYDKINTLMGRLVSLLRYSMENYEQTVRFKQEFAYLEDYAELLNMRYKCRILLHAEVEEPLEGLLIPKLSLQPLIENAVFHGILPKKTEEGHIHIRLYSLPAPDHLVVLEVRDNGVGLAERELERLRLHLLREESNENIGLKNVWMRLRLMFGKTAEVQLESRPGEGMTIRFLFPADTVQVREEENPDEQIQGDSGGG